MSYADDSNENGKGNPKSLLGEVVTEYLGSTLASPVLASAFRVLSRRAPTLGAVAAPARMNPVLLEARRRAAIAASAPRPVVRQVPTISIASLPNGTAVPMPVSQYGPPSASPSPRGGMGPPPSMNAPIVSTISDDGDSNVQQAGMASLAGLTGNPMLLGIVALAAFMFLDGNKPKRRRR